MIEHAELTRKDELLPFLGQIAFPRDGLFEIHDRLVRRDGNGQLVGLDIRRTLDVAARVSVGHSPSGGSRSAAERGRGKTDTVISPGAAVLEVEADAWSAILSMGYL